MKQVFLVLLGTSPTDKPQDPLYHMTAVYCQPYHIQHFKKMHMFQASW